MSEGDEALPFSASGESGDTSPSEISFSEAAIIPNGVETPSSNQSYGNGSKANASMPIAVIGIAVRAGSASTPDEFFEMLSRGRSSWVPDIPQERFNNASFYHPNPGKPGCINTNGACFIKQDVTKFDAPFFSMTELEATSLDPQQRLLLECAFEALENAGVQKHNTIGKDVGVFIGAGSPEYEYNLFRDSETMPMFQATG
jgi:acyl transferase domain-containing protein